MAEKDEMHWFDDPYYDELAKRAKERLEQSTDEEHNKRIENFKERLKRSQDE